MNFTLTRQSDNGIETLGILKSTVPEVSFQCNTLERPYLHNLHNVSAVPAGTYTCTWSFMPDMNTYHYELQNVPGRSGIFIHNGNYVSNSEGCILLGATEADINHDGQADITSSVNTLEKFETLCGKQDIQLTIIAVS